MSQGRLLLCELVVKVDGFGFSLELLDYVGERLWVDAVLDKRHEQGQRALVHAAVQ